MHRKIQVAKRYKHAATSDDFYIGTGTAFSNPFSNVQNGEIAEQNLCDSEEEAVDRYREYFKEIMEGCACGHKILRRQVRDLIIKLKEGGSVVLVCNCTFSYCHGDVIRDYIISEL